MTKFNLSFKETDYVLNFVKKAVLCPEIAMSVVNNEIEGEKLLDEFTIFLREEKTLITRFLVMARRQPEMNEIKRPSNGYWKF